MTDESRRARKPYPTEMRERAVRMVFDHQGEYNSQWAAIENISRELGINHETLRIWVRLELNLHQRRVPVCRRLGWHLAQLLLTPVFSVLEKPSRAWLAAAVRWPIGSTMTQR